MQSNVDFLSQKSVKQFIAENIHSDPANLILNPPRGLEEHIGIIADQIIARRKANGKLTDWYENYDLIMPPPLSIEQASSDLTSKYKQQLINGEVLIDLTGGMGIDCVALSNSVSKTVYVEKNKELCQVFAHNTKILKKDIEIKNDEAENYISTLRENGNSVSVYIDPARRDKHKNRIFKIVDCSPNLLDLLPILTERVSQILVKYSPLLDIKSIFRSIKGLKEIHSVSVKNDCKELLLAIESNYPDEPTITCTNLASDQKTYSFLLSEESNSKSQLSDAKQFILEPNASILKAGAFNKIALDFELQKLGENTHLYTSSNLKSSFPGRIFQVIEPATKTALKKYAINGKINVLTRNHPQNATDLKKKWKLKDGGNYFLIGYRDLKKKPQILIAERVS
ncbi:MAG: RsmD family RNA methyltransferase [Ekhidna sp.]|nr:RsmD family RNA methyltransferase [Ekhidna sp.]